MRLLEEVVLKEDKTSSDKNSCQGKRREPVISFRKPGKAKPRDYSPPPEQTYLPLPESPRMDYEALWDFKEDRKPSPAYLQKHSSQQEERTVKVIEPERKGLLTEKERGKVIEKVELAKQLGDWGRIGYAEMERYQYQRHFDRALSSAQRAMCPYRCKKPGPQLQMV